MGRSSCFSVRQTALRQQPGRRPAAAPPAEAAPSAGAGDILRLDGRAVHRRQPPLHAQHRAGRQAGQRQAASGRQAAAHHLLRPQRRGGVLLGQQHPCGTAARGPTPPAAPCRAGPAPTAPSTGAAAPPRPPAVRTAATIAPVRREKCHIDHVRLTSRVVYRALRRLMPRWKFPLSFSRRMCYTVR